MTGESNICGEGVSSRNDLKGIQCLRGIAAMLVVALHAGIFTFGMSETGNIGVLTLGNAGVDIFFVISGFVMYVSTLSKEKSPLLFLYERWARIAPLYYLFTVIYVFLLFLDGSKLPSIADLFTTLAFIPWVNSISGVAMPVLGVGWTLNYEMIFYLFVCVAMVFPKNVRIISISICFGGLAASRFLFHPTNPALARLASPLWLEFIFGILAGKVLFPSCALDRYRNILNNCDIGMILSGVGFILMSVPVLCGLVLPRTFGYGIPALAIVIGFAISEPLFDRPTMNWLRKIGDSSYSLYLSHGILIFVLRSVGIVLPQALTSCFLLLVVSIVFGYLCYVFIERPFGSILKRRKRPSST